VGDADLAQATVCDIASGLGESVTAPDRDRGDYFASAARAVTKDVESYPTAALLRALIANEAACTNDEVRTCLEFIYSHMVSKFQGPSRSFSPCAMGVCSAVVSMEARRTIAARGEGGVLS